MILLRDSNGLEFASFEISLTGFTTTPKNPFTYALGPWIVWGSDGSTLAVIEQVDYSDPLAGEYRAQVFGWDREARTVSHIAQFDKVPAPVVDVRVAPDGELVSLICVAWSDGGRDWRFHLN